MTTPANGNVPAQFLAPIGDGLQAEANTAAAYNRLRAAHPEVHTNGAASAYWSRSLDVAIHANPGRYNISASEAKALSPVGRSPHGLGTRLNFSGVSAAVAKQFGFAAFNAYTFSYEGPYSWDGQTRTNAPVVGRVRILPTTKSAIYRLLKPGERFIVIGYAHGETIGASDVWYGLENGWVSASITQQGAVTDGLTNLIPATDPVPAPSAPAPTAAPATPVVSPPVVYTPEPKAPVVNPPKSLTPAQLAADTAKLQADSDALAGVAPTALAGLLAGRPKARKRAYVGYAVAALLVSFGPDVVTYGVVTGSHVAPFVSIIGLSTSIVLKVGAAFGLVAASNAKG